jgi:PIN domain nuclease of toxin-antitoxin system
MRLLLDTHAFLWWADHPERLSADALHACSDLQTQLIVSVVSAWEMQIKMQLGKLRLRLPLDQLISHQQQVNDVQVLPVELTHVLALGALPSHHKDPFDRLLIAQALDEGLTLVTADSAFASYPIQILW